MGGEIDADISGKTTDVYVLYSFTDIQDVWMAG